MSMYHCVSPALFAAALVCFYPLAAVAEPSFVEVRLDVPVSDQPLSTISVKIPHVVLKELELFGNVSFVILNENGETIAEGHEFGEIIAAKFGDFGVTVASDRLNLFLKVDDFCTSWSPLNRLRMTSIKSLNYIDIDLNCTRDALQVLNFDDSAVATILRLIEGRSRPSLDWYFDDELEWVGELFDRPLDPDRRRLCAGCGIDEEYLLAWEFLNFLDYQVMNDVASFSGSSNVEIGIRKTNGRFFQGTALEDTTKWDETDFHPLSSIFELDFDLVAMDTVRFSFENPSGKVAIFREISGDLYLEGIK